MNGQVCVRCGGHLEATSMTICRYCGAHQPLPNGCVPLTPEGVLGLLRQEMTGVDSVSVHPAIPPKKLAGVRKSHPYLPPDEVILAVYDGTVFGSATDGFYVTAHRLGFKNQYEAAQFFDWPSIHPGDVYTDGSNVVVGNARLGTLYGEEDEAVDHWAWAIQKIALSARPALAQQVAERIQALSAPPPPAGPTAWDAVATSWPPPPPVYPPDIVEHLPQCPYRMFEGPDVVDVQPSGQLIAVCGDALVELRYAAGGARFRAFQAFDDVVAVKFSPDGKTLAVGTTDRKATLYDVETGRILAQSPPMGDNCEAIVWLDSSRLAIGSQCGELWIVGLQEGRLEPIHRILGVAADYMQLGGLAATTDGRVVFASIGERIGAFDTTTGKILWRFDRALMNESRLTVSPRGDILVAASSSGLALFDARTGQPGARMLLGHARGVTWPDPEAYGAEPITMSWESRPQFSPNGDLVALQDPIGNLVLLDTTTFALHAMPRDHGRAWIEDLAWFADGNHVAIACADNSLAVWRLRPLTRMMHTTALIR